MANHAAFLRDIIAHPDDDTSRLVYADWLDEHGDSARAEFIRVQCRLASSPEDDPRRLALSDRERELLAAHEAKWLGPLPKHVSDWTFTQGFLESLTFEGNLNYADREYRALDGAEELFQRHPIRQMKFGWARGQAGVLAESPLLDQITSLLLHLDLGEGPSVETLLRSGRMTKLTDLTLWGGMLENTFGVALDSSACAPGLRTLWLDCTFLRHQAVPSFVRSQKLAQLSELHLRCHLLGDETFDPVLGPEHARRWTQLSLGAAMSGGLTAKQVPRLAACDRLAHLSLAFSDMGPRPLTELARIDWLGSLHSLELSLGRLESRRCGDALSGVLRCLAPRPVLRLRLWSLTDDMMTRLLRLPHLDRLGGLHIERAGSSCRLLAGASELTGLSELEIAHGSIRPEDVAPLARSPALARLKRLSLTRCPLSDRGLQILTELWSCPELRALNLRGTGVCRPGMEALATWPGLARLSELDLSSNALADDDLQPLVNSPHLSPLTRLDLRENPDLGNAVKQTLRDRLGRRLLV